MKELKFTKATSTSPLGSTYRPKFLSHRAIKLEIQEVTIPSQNSSADPAINERSISNPKSKAYYAIKSKFQEDRDESPPPKVPIPHIPRAAREELWVIWKSDPRVPTVASRHAWAVSRNISPLRVDQWFSNRKSQAKKQGRPISSDSYELSLKPRAVPVTLEVKRELLSPSPACSDRTDVDSPSDTLVTFGAYGSDSSCVSLRSSVSALSMRSSVSTLSMAPEPTQGNLYLLHDVQNSSPVSRTLTPGTDVEKDAGYDKDLYSLAPSFSLYDDRSTDNIPCSEDLLQRVCNQGESDISDFICTLCKPMEGDTSLVIHFRAVHILIRYLCTDLRGLDYPKIALDELVKQSIFSFDTSVTMLPAYARLDPTPDTRMELSAIPYLFCTPDLAFIPTPSGSSAS
ncbi:uncharacterized protein EDB93DRAFT_1161480 [Suillus bovinus]|uniref:uncharacterized protein n=1 Tax=Suillus bovinus TaxID=48563 RepID=UPI001B87741D|nr:uncharacterized protein EDB93DRAFT_1161480 [Suillus bovinus]KAG2140499.1 hypothetical protein EDB93DRAFT_1161480 [Suillus bovinus]